MTAGAARPAFGSWRRWSTPMWGALVAGSCSFASAEPPGSPLLTPLGLVGHPTGTTPPPFSGGTADTGHVSLATLRGRVVLVNFWASWCLECRSEMPVLERLHRALGPRGLAVVGVNARESRRTVSRYASDLGLTFPLVTDPDGRIDTLLAEPAPRVEER